MLELSAFNVKLGRKKKNKPFFMSRTRLEINLNIVVTLWVLVERQGFFYWIFGLPVGNV